LDILNLLSPVEFKIFLLILIRISIVLFLFPLFGGKMLPPMVKAGLSLIMAFVLFPVVPIDPAVFPDNALDTLILIFCEFFIGMALALAIHVFFAAAQLAGQLVGMQMGFALITMLDPQSGENLSIMDQIGYWVSSLLFLTLNGHHVLITTLVDSFSIVKSGMIQFKAGLLQQMIVMTAHIFALSIKIGAPAIAALLFTSTAFGVTAKFVPQMNILIVAFPLKIFVGLIFFGISLQILAAFAPAYIVWLQAMMKAMLRMMAVT